MKLKIPMIGGICQSTQGRDKGRYYLIKLIYPDGSVGVVDGNFKKLATPKLIDGRQVFDTEVYSALKGYNCPKPEVEQ